MRLEKKKWDKYNYCSHCMEIGHSTCNECHRCGPKMIAIATDGIHIDSGLTLCPTCLQSLRSKIEVLSILVSTGINTKEEV